MSKPFYKNKVTGNYGVLEGHVISNQAGIGMSSFLLESPDMETMSKLRDALRARNPQHF